jgi:UDP-N-acetylmuramyl pentapeptide phosphotransferase/UDP-N-acetylglucosamine-1-phosphate transferase
MALRLPLDTLIHDWRYAAPLLGFACFVVSLILTRIVLALLRRWRVIDHPNHRSSHKTPTPRGGGWGVMLTMLPAWGLVAHFTGSWTQLAPILFGCVGLIGVSWFDDRGGLGAGSRFVMQIVAVAFGLLALPREAMIFQDLLPLWGDRLAAAVVWLWFVNLFNFMDGIDGLAGGEALAAGGGLALIAGLTGVGGLTLPLYGAALAGSALGFLVWNRHPAKVFMGDVGSVPLGYTLGFLLLTLAAAGHWLPALLLPAYFLADATLTLLRRIFRLEKVWRAHKEHFYQKAVQQGYTHAQTSRRVLILNLTLIGLAVLSLQPGGWAVIPTAVCAVGILLLAFARGRENPQ